MTSVDPTPPASRASRKRWVLAATILGSSMTFVDATVVNVALPALQTNLHATITGVQWIIESYALFLGALILIGGSMGDQFGRKRVFLSGVVFFAVASILCGLATSTQALIVGRALQGCGAAFLVPGSLAIISATFDEAERGRAIGTWSGFSAMAAAIGPVLGGWLIEHVSWRSAFFINVPLAAMVVALSLRFMDESRDTSRSMRVDWTGAVLAVVGLGGVVFALLEWPARGTDPLVAGTMAAGFLSLLLFLVVEAGVANPMLPLALFRSRVFTVANVLTFLLYGVLAVVFFLVPMNLIQVQGYSAAGAGAALLPFPLLMFVLSRWSGSLVARMGSRVPLTIGPAIAAGGVALYARSGIGSSYWTTFFPAVIVLGLGMSITVAPLTTTVMGAVESEHAGVASGINNAVSRVAGLLAVALFGVLLVQTFDADTRTSLDRIHLSETARTAIDRELPKLAGADVSSIPSIEESQREAVRRAILDGFVRAFRVVFVSAALAALAGAVIVGVWLRDNDKPARASGPPQL